MRTFNVSNWLGVMALAAQGSTPNVMTSLCCSDGSSVSVINTARNRVTRTTPLGSAASLVAFDPSGAHAFFFDASRFAILREQTATGNVTLSISTAKTAALAMLLTKDGTEIYLAIGNTVTVYNAVDGSTINTINLEVTVTGLALSADGSRVFAVADVQGPEPDHTAAFLTSSLLAAISTTTHSVIALGHIPYDSTFVAAAPDGKTLWVAYSSDFVHNAGVESVDATTLRRTGNLSDPGPTAEAITSDGSYLVVGENSGGVRFYSLPSGTLAGQASTSGTISALAIKPDSSAVYAAMGATNAVQAISIPGFADEATLSVGNTPSDIAFQPGTEDVWVTNQLPSTALKLDATDSQIVSAQGALHEPFEFAPGPNGTLYVTEYQSNTVAQLDGNGNILTRIAVERNPQHLAASADRTRIYVANRLGTQGFQPSVSVIDTESNTVVTRWDVTAGTVEQVGVAVSPDGGTVYVASVSLFAYNSLTGALENTLTIPNENVYFPAVMPGGKSLYVSGIAGVYRVSTNTFQVLASVRFGDGCYLPLALRPDGKEVWVADSDDQLVGVINTANNALSTISLPTAPLGFAFTQDSSEALTTTGRGLCIVDGGPAPGTAVIELSTTQHAVTGSITVGGPQVGIIVN